VVVYNSWMFVWIDVMGGLVPWSVFLMDGHMWVEECVKGEGGGVKRSLREKMDDAQTSQTKPRQRLHSLQWAAHGLGAHSKELFRPHSRLLSAKC
jgi:hypothetical protein